jgi:hypothetical protein
MISITKFPHNGPFLSGNARRVTISTKIGRRFQQGKPLEQSVGFWDERGTGVPWSRLSDRAKLGHDMLPVRGEIIGAEDTGLLFGGYPGLFLNLSLVTDEYFQVLINGLW